MVKRAAPESRKASQPRSMPALATNDDDLVSARAACEAINGSTIDNYSTWIAVGQALSMLGTVGLELWDYVSSKGAKYKPGECAQKWASFNGNGRTLKTLYHIAYQDDPGWQKRLRATQRAAEPFVVETSEAPDIQDNTQAASVQQAANLSVDVQVTPCQDGQQPQCQTQPTVTDALRAHKPLPQAARFALLNIAEPFSLLGEVIAQTGVGVDSPATIDDFKAASDAIGAGIAGRTIYRAAQWALTKGIFTKVTHILSLHEREKTSIGRFVKSPGRPPDRYQLAAASALRIVFRGLAEQPAIKRRFADQGIVPLPRADVLSAYSDMPATDAQQIAALLRTELKDKINAQPGYQGARKRTQKDVARYVEALACTDGGPPLNVPFSTARAYKCAVLRVHIEANDGKPLSRAYLARLVNCSSRRIVELLGAAGIASEKSAPIVQNVSPTRARTMAERIATSGRADYSIELNAYPVAIVAGNERVVLSPSALPAVEQAIATAGSAPVSIEYRGADIRKIATPTMPEVNRRERVMTMPDGQSQMSKVTRVATAASKYQFVINPDAPIICRTEKQWAAACVGFVERWLGMKTSWRAQGDHLTDTSTGEMLPHTRQNVMALLVDKTPPDTFEPDESYRNISDVTLLPMPPSFDAVAKLTDAETVAVFAHYGSEFDAAYLTWEPDRANQRRQAAIEAQRAARRSVAVPVSLPPGQSVTFQQQAALPTLTPMVSYD